MGRITNEAAASLAADMAKWQPMQHSEHTIASGSSIPMTSLSQADIKKIKLQQLGHGSPENFKITPEQLDGQKSKLAPIQYTASPFASHLFIQRQLPCTSTQFVDFARATRDQLTQLASTTSGQELFQALDYHAIPTLHTVQSSEPNSALQQMAVRMSLQHTTTITNPDLTQPGIKESTFTWNPQEQLQLNPDGTIKNAGLGSSTTVIHQPDILQRAADPEHGKLGDDNVRRPLKEIDNSATYDSAIALGHELIHAAQSLSGLSDFNFRPDGLQHGERNTVGPLDGETRVFQHIPTENMLRKDMNEQYYQGATMVGPLPLRDNYSGIPISEIGMEERAARLQTHTQPQSQDSLQGSASPQKD